MGSANRSLALSATSARNSGQSHRTTHNARKGKSMALPITFNYDNTLEKAIAEEGLRPQDLKAAEEPATAAVKSFKLLVESGEIGFPSLPDDTATLRAVQQFANSMRARI